MGSSKFEFETYKTKKKFKTNKLGEREYIVGCVPYKISPLVCHREDAVRKEQHLPIRTATNRPQTAWSAFDRHVQGSCYLIQSHRGSIVPIHVVARCMADPNVGQRFYRSGVTIVNVVQIDVGTLPYICKPISTRTSLTCETLGRGRIWKWTRK